MRPSPSIRYSRNSLPTSFVLSIAVCILSMALFPAGRVMAAELPDGWVSFDGWTTEPTAPAIQLISSDASHVVIRIDTPGVLVETIERDGTEFKRLSVPGYFHSGTVGHPALPAIRRLIAVPKDCDVTVSATALDSLLFTDCTVYPVEAPVVKYTEEGWEYIDHEFAYDGEAYCRGGYSPGSWSETGDTGSFRGQGVVRLTGHPMQTDASKSELRVFPSVLVTLELTGGSGGMSEEIGPFSEIAEVLMLGYEGSGSIGWRESADPGRWGVLRTLGACEDSLTDYLMIVEGSLMGSRHLNALAEHRATYNGFNVAIVPDTTVFELCGEVAISDTAIHHFIQSLYVTESAEHMRDDRLGYVLLVGDARDEAHGGLNSLIPAHETQVTVTGWTTNDLWYSCVDGNNDLHPDLMIGRLCVSDTTELGREVQKIVSYEGTASSTDDWRTRILMTSGFCESEDENKAATAHAAFEYARTLISDHAVTEIHADQEIGANCGVKQGVVREAQRESINAGLHLLETCAHGCTHHTETFLRADVALLTNCEGQLPFWMSYACLTGSYDAYNEDIDTWECLGEALMHQQEDLTGAVSFFGSSESSLDAWADIGAYVWEAIFNHGHNRTGNFITFAKLKYQALRSDSDTQFRHDLMYNLLGDPALDLLLADTEGAGYSSAPDYAVRSRDVEMVPDDFPSSGDTVRFRVEVLNESNYIPDGPVDVLFELWNPESSVWDSLDTTQVQPGDWSSETTSILWTTSPSYTGRTELRIRVDPNGEQDELSELNNEAERPVCVYIERDGFPVNMWGADGVAPAFADINGDGLDDVVSGTRVPGRILAVSCSAESLWTYVVPLGNALLGPVSIADLDAGGDPEIVFTRTGYVDALNLDGDPASGWSPRFMKGLVGAAVLGDVCYGDSLGDVEIAVERAWTIHNWQHFIRVVRHDGTGDEWEASWIVAALDVSFVERSPIIVDLDGDGRSEVVAAYVTVVNALGVDSAVSAHASSDGEELWLVESFGQSDGLPCSPAAADVVVDSTGIEVLFAAGTVMCLSSRGHTCWECGIAGGAAGLAVEDLDADGGLEVIVATYHAPGSIENCSGVLYVIDSEGSVVDSIATDRAFTTQPVMADLDGDGNVEILTMSCRDEMLDWERKTISHLDIFTFDTATRTLARFDELERPFLFWGLATGTPAVRDTDADGYLEIWLADGEGLLHCLDLAQLNLSGKLSRWSCFQHDARHTGVYETPVSGPYPAYADVSWWGDYLLTGDVTVDITSSILIQPGTTVRVVAGADDQTWGADPNATELIVQGDVVALADTALAPIRFMSAAADPAPGNWYGIRLRPYSHGEFEGCIVRDAFIGISAHQPDTIRVEDCRIVECEAVGIKCTDQQGWGDILVRRNFITDAQTGIYLGWCGATADSNTITDCGSYGIRMISDYESDIIGNTIYFPYSSSGGPFSGISVDGTLNRRHNTLEISDNTITNARTSGITCKNQGRDSEVYITSNRILVEEYHPTSKAMYFDFSEAIPRHNEIDGTRDAFWIESATEYQVPNLGITMGDGGYNSVDWTWLRFGVCAGPNCQTEVRAEANWWGTGSPTERMFMGVVDWRPFLVADPYDRGGSGDEDEVEERIPFCLIQNSPNPFNPMTSLRFGLPARQHVSLSIYDISGRCVTTLVDDTVEAGWHDIVWDGRDDARHRVSSGVYFCRLVSQGSTSVKKVVLLK